MGYILGGGQYCQRSRYITMHVFLCPVTPLCMTVMINKKHYLLLLSLFTVTKRKVYSMKIQILADLTTFWHWPLTFELQRTCEDCYYGYGFKPFWPWDFVYAHTHRHTNASVSAWIFIRYILLHKVVKSADTVEETLKPSVLQCSSFKIHQVFHTLELEVNKTFHCPLKSYRRWTITSESSSCDLWTSYVKLFHQFCSLLCDLVNVTIS